MASTLPASFDFQNQPKLDSDFTKNRFQDQVIVVTGGSGGIGSGFVRRFINDGAKVAIVDLNDIRGLELATELGVRAKFYKCDVTLKSNCAQLVEEITRDFGKINHLVNAVACFISKVT